MPEPSSSDPLVVEVYDTVGELAGAVVLGEAGGWRLLRVDRDEYGRLRAEYERTSSAPP